MLFLLLLCRLLSGMQGSLIAQRQQPLTWHKAYFNTSDGDEPLALDMNSMGKGQVWINGESIGRYWTAYGVGNCSGCRYTVVSVLQSANSGVVSQLSDGIMCQGHG